MAQSSEDIQNLLGLLADKEKRQRRNTLLYLGLPLLAGIVLTILTGYQAIELKRKSQELYELNIELNKTREELNKAKEQRDKTIKQDEIIRGAQIDLQSRDYSKAIRELEKAIELDPTNPSPYNLIGYAQLRMNDVAQSIETLKRSLEIKPNYTWGHYNLALAYWAQGDHERAIEEVKKTLEIDPKFRERFRKDGQFRKFRSSPEYRNIIEKQEDKQNRPISR